jgi:signal transduction histidine kinase
MFVNYRRSHRLSDAEREIVETIASAAAIALKNSRLLKTISTEEREKAWQQFTAKVAHRVNAEIADIAGASDRLKSSLESPSQAEVVPCLLKRIDDAVNTLESLADEFSRFATPPEYDKSKAIDVNELLRDAKDRFAVQGVEKIQIIMDLTEPLPLIQGDEEHLRYAFSEMIRNAAIAMPDGGKLHIGTQILANENRSGPRLCITLEDTGFGISDVFKERIFEPGFRDRLGGTGFGLTIVKQTIEAHGGTIREEGIYKQGAKFIIEFPIS